MRSLYGFTTKTQKTRKKRGDKKREVSGSSLLAFGLLYAFAVCMFLFSSCFAPFITNAQTGDITGRVVSEDGVGLPNITVFLSPVRSSPRQAPDDQPETFVTDKDGNFMFSGLAPGRYSVYAASWKGYISRPVPASERGAPRTYQPGDNVTLTLVRGGVITGRVTTSTGEPMVGVLVSVMMVKDFDGNPRRDVVIRGGLQRSTDDRGEYRIFGLALGTYVVFTRGDQPGSEVSAYDGYAPTYHPSSPRETAGEITVTSGGEATGVDIRYRGERGYTVSGVVSGPSTGAQNVGTYVYLYKASTSFQAGRARAVIRPGDGQSGFAIVGVTDGEYEIVARRSWAPGEYSDSPPRHITVRGGDLGGINLRVEPSAMVSGKIVEAPPKVCGGDSKSSPGDITVMARRGVTAPPGLSFLRPFIYGGSTTDRGEFTIYRLDPDKYFIVTRLPDENWFVKSIAAPTAAAGRTRSAANYDAGRNGLTVKSGERMTGLIVTIADGAASLSGKVAPDSEGSELPARMIVHLVPAETAAAGDLLRYGETAVGRDNSFEFKNLAPGKYRLLVHAANDIQFGDSPPAPVAWDANERAKLRKEAEAMKNEIDLKPCQRVSDRVVEYR
ncbi:MAG: carboxypeptidase regulatory-like domain-containing protein [Chloracidobacterium sp.]|nr:carboxypeptidase regulatory-like domain-containing protein [Chloracidobacterium sp.]